MKNSKFKFHVSNFVVGFYFLVILGLFLYSYTQVDLSLTLSRASIFQYIEKAFQYIGYFQRPLSAFLYCLLLGLLFGFYFWFLFLVQKGMLSRRRLWLLVGFCAVLLAFSYNAFSYDLFNYIFDAKIFTHYHMNPYLHKALDFPHDPMLSFMHWTQRTYPYGPVWLGVTVPLSYMGLGYFFFTFFLFKFLAAGSYIGCVYYIEKLSKKLFSEHALFNTLFFALNPLVLVEFLVSGHIDVFMIFLALVSLYYLFINKTLFSLFLLFLSIGVKFATGLMLPFYFVIIFGRRFLKFVDIELMFVVLFISMIFSVILASIRTNYQPWYLLSALPFGAFVVKKDYIFIPSIIFSIFSLIIYVPFLYQGDWNGAVPLILTWLYILPIVLSVLCVFGYRLFFVKNMVK